VDANLLSQVTLGSAFFLGAAHALEPGHGKTLVAAYLTGTRGRVSDALLLGLLVTLFHTLSVSLIGLAAITVASQFISMQSELLRVLEILSGLIILGIGLMMFHRRFIQDKGASECECHLHHVHHDSHVSVDAMQLNQNGSLTASRQSSFREVFSLGLASGISPCPTAVAMLIMALASGGFTRLPQAMLTQLTFSIGLSSVLVIIGLVIVLGADKISNRLIDRNSKLPMLVSGFSSLMIIGLGLYLTIHAMVAPPEAIAGGALGLLSAGLK
jgi:nickel/cobalt exporter